MKPHVINSTDTFIRGWYIDTSVCDHLITLYNREDIIKAAGLSRDPNEPTPSIKDSIDVTIGSSLISEITPYLNALKTCMDLYSDIFPESCGHRGYFLKEAVNIQHYLVGGGFKVWHCERGSSDEHIRDRHLVFMTYLNDVDDGGTEFLYQKTTIKAEKGLTLLWPADWTYTHKGQISYTKEKTIITGWLSY
jgi:prolyl 4-hydroxylase